MQKGQFLQLFRASFDIYIENIALFALADFDLPRQMLPGVRSQSDVKLSHNLFKLITFCD